MAAERGARLAVFARPGDRLWLPGEPPDGVAVPEGVEIETGPLEALPPAPEILAWGEGPRVRDLRNLRDGERPPARDLATLSLHEAVWRLPVSEPPIVARVAHRRFGFRVAGERGWSLPGAGVATDAGEAERLVTRIDARWIAKGAWSAAGRERVLGESAAAFRDAETRVRVESLLARHGALVVEPWVERTADFGCAGFVTPTGARLVSLHGQEIDRRGVSRAIVPLPSDFVPLPSDERELLETAFQAAAEALQGEGFAGPFGIDAFRWLDGGRERLHPLVEINPRFTFGWVAAAERSRPGR